MLEPLAIGAVLSATLGVVGAAVGGARVWRMPRRQKKRLVKKVSRRAWNWLEERSLVPRNSPFIEDRFALYPDLERLERHHPLIKKECLELLARPDWLVPMETMGGGYTRAGIHGAGWNTFLLKSGRFVDENCRRAPETARLLRDMPRVVTAFFSVLEPGKYLEPHFGYYKGFLRYHLAVVVPNDNAGGECWIRLSEHGQRGDKRNRENIERGEKYHWHEGEGVLFDDTYLHDARNSGDGPRVVLFLDLLKPLPWPLDWIHRAVVSFAHLDPSMRRLRREASRIAEH